MISTKKLSAYILGGMLAIAGAATAGATDGEASSESTAEAPEAAVSAPKTPSAPTPPAEVKAFLDRVFAALPAGTPTASSFKSWEAAGKPTEEGFGLMPSPGLNPEAVVARVMDVNHYVGNLDNVLENRSIADSRFKPPTSVRFYQRLDLSLLGEIHHELVLVDGGTRQGYRLVYWYLLDKETQALGTDKGARSQYNVGAWVVSDKAIGYALSSAPVRDDVGFLKWTALTDGANVAAESVVKANIEGMVAWASR